MSRATLLALAARCEAAIGADEGLRDDIAFALGWRLRDAIWWKPPSGEWQMGLPDWLGALEASFSLITKGMRVGALVKQPDYTIVNLCEVTTGIFYGNGTAATFELALCAAALRALALRPSAATMEDGE